MTAVAHDAHSADDESGPLDDRELLFEVVLALVDRHDRVRVEEKEAGDTTHFTIHVAGEDVGKVIGRNGETVSLLRRLFGRIAAVQGRQCAIQVFEPDKDRPGNLAVYRHRKYVAA